MGKIDDDLITALTTPDHSKTQQSTNMRMIRGMYYIFTPTCLIYERHVIIYGGINTFDLQLIIYDSL